MTMRRRTFLQAGALGTLGSVALARTRPPKDRPNILVIMSDEHNAAVTGCYGNQVVQTPNLDRIARRGRRG